MSSLRYKRELTRNSSQRIPNDHILHPPARGELAARLDGRILSCDRRAGKSARENDTNLCHKRIDLLESRDTPNWRVVVGVVEHVKRAAFETDRSYQVYAPLGQMPMRTMQIVAHAVGDPLVAVRQMKELLVRYAPKESA